MDTTVILPLDEVERRAIVHALKVTDNNISDAARAWTDPHFTGN